MTAARGVLPDMSRTYRREMPSYSRSWWLDLNARDQFFEVAQQQVARMNSGRFGRKPVSLSSCDDWQTRKFKRTGASYGRALLERREQES